MEWTGIELKEPARVQVLSLRSCEKHTAIPVPSAARQTSLLSFTMLFKLDPLVHSFCGHCSFSRGSSMEGHLSDLNTQLPNSSSCCSSVSDHWSEATEETTSFQSEFFYSFLNVKHGPGSEALESLMWEQDYSLCWTAGRDRLFLQITFCWSLAGCPNIPGFILFDSTCLFNEICCL